jgi:hypothetical protein
VHTTAGEHDSRKNSLQQEGSGPFFLLKEILPAVVLPFFLLKRSGVSTGRRGTA